MSSTQPTQVRRPWRATVRTGFAVIVALAAMLPLLVDAAGLDETLPPVAIALAIASAITRIMALPAVEQFLQRFLPFLAAEPQPGPRHAADDTGHIDTWLAVGLIVLMVLVLLALLGVLRLG